MYYIILYVANFSYLTSPLVHVAWTDPLNNNHFPFYLKKRKKIQLISQIPQIFFLLLL